MSPPAEQNATCQNRTMQRCPTALTSNLSDDDGDHLPPERDAPRKCPVVPVQETVEQQCWWWCLYSWMLLLCDAIGLLGFVLVLLPGFIHFAWYYAVTSRRTSVAYGTQSCRQTVDVYAAASHAENHAEEEDDDNSACPAAEPLLGQEEREPASHLRPVILFFPGGAWMIGYKMWGALTARALSSRWFDYVVVVADYRNHIPVVGGCCNNTIPDMVDDVSQAIQWTADHVHEYGGNPQQITVVGQSAGGHLLTTAVLRRARQLQQERSAAAMAPQLRAASTAAAREEEEEEEGDDAASDMTRETLLNLQQQQQQQHEQTDGSKESSSPTLMSGKNGATEDAAGDEDSENHNDIAPAISWRPTDLKGLVSVSAPYHFPVMGSTFRRHGLSARVLQQMFGDDEQQDDYDPLRLASSSSSSSLAALPPVQIWHGTLDATVPWTSAQAFAAALQQHGGQQQTVEFRLYDDWTHTNAILEGPLSGQHDFHFALAAKVHEWSTSGNRGAAETSLEARARADDANDDDPWALRPMLWGCPKLLAQWAQFCIPF